MKPIGWIVAAHAVLGLIYAVTTPLFEASDELWHYPMVQTLAAGNPLPVQDAADVGPWRQEASQPPLYYWLMAQATRWIDQSDMPQVRWLNPHVDNGVVTPDGNTNLAIHTEREGWPWRGAVLAVRLSRILSVLLGAGTVYLTYRIALELEPDRADPALAAAAFVAFTPMFIFIAGSVNNDNLVVPLSSATLLVLVHLARSAGWGRFRRFGRWAGPAACLTLGVLLGLGALAKESTLGLFPLAAVVLVYVWWREKTEGRGPKTDKRPLRATKDDGRRTTDDRRPKTDQRPAISGRQPATSNHQPATSNQPPITFHFPAFVHRLSSFVLYSTLTALPAVAIAGWWYYRNVVLYGDPLGWNAFIAVLGKRAAPASLAQLWGERAGFMQSYWGLFGGVNVPMPDWAYAALNTVAVVAAAGLGLYLWRRIRRHGFDLAAWLPLGLTAAWLGLVILGLIRWATVTWSSQGRLSFSAISSIAALFAFGLTAWFPRRFQPWAAGLVAAFMAALSLAAPFAWIGPAYAAPRPLTLDEIGAIPNRLDADFGGQMTLLGYAFSPDEVRPGESVEVTLYWQSQIAMDRDWSVFVHLRDEAEIVVAQRDTYPGLGKLPTRRMTPGMAIADRYVIRLPETAFAPSRLDVVVGLYDLLDGTRLRVGDGDSLTLGSVALAARPGAHPNPLAVNFGDQIRLVGYNLDQRAAVPGGSIRLDLYWQAIRPMRVNYSIFTHVRGQGETLWAQSDAWPQAGNAPTSGWVAGQIVADTYTLTLRPDTPPGVYDIEIGVYDGASGDRLQIVTPGGRLTDDFVNLSKVRVVSP